MVTIYSVSNIRVTLLECCPGFHRALRLFHIVDVILCMVDATSGYEIELYELSCLIQVFGFTRLACVLTHLDRICNVKSLACIVRQLRYRL